MSTASEVEREMLALINQERTSRGLDPLQLERQLNESSEDHSAWMLNTDRFSHTGSGGSSATQRMQSAGFDLEGSWRTGENIAWQSERGALGISDDVAQLHQNLMNSPGHRANILNPDFKYIGIGVETGDMQGFDAVMVTQNFATTDAEVMLDIDDTAMTPPPAEDPVPEEPETDVTETEDPTQEQPVTDVTETEDPEPEQPETDVTETEDPEPEQPETDVTETEDPEPEQPETDVTETEDPEPELPETDVTETEDPEPEQPETDVTETEDPEPEQPETDVTETDDPEPEQPETNVTEIEDPDSGCFDVAAFLAEIEAFIQQLQMQLDQFAWNDDVMTPDEPEDDLDLVMVDDMDPSSDDTSCPEMASDDSGDVFFVNFFNFDCMMDVA